jgi:hypothetical protein
MRIQGLPFVTVALVCIALAFGLKPDLACADDGFRFYYNFPSDRPFYEMSRSTQESGTQLVSSFRKTVEFQAAEVPGGDVTRLNARILTLSNKGRAIDYYTSVIFHADISPTGEISNYSWSGGLPRYRALIQAAGPANRRNIFWLPQFPDEPLFIGDSFVDRTSAANATGETVFTLERVRDNLAFFSVLNSGLLGGIGVSGEQQSEGSAVFDFNAGMWQSLELQGEGSASLPNGLTRSYKTSKQQHIASYAGCDPGTTGVNNAPAMIDHARQLAGQITTNAVGTFPVSSGDVLHSLHRHFLCPDRSQHRTIENNFINADRALPLILPSCISASATVCAGPSNPMLNMPQITGGAPTGRHLVQLCPVFFTRPDDEQAGTLIAAAAKLGGVNDSHQCLLPQACYYDFLQPSSNMISSNPFAYAYYALERMGWTLSRQPSRTPCYPQASGLSAFVPGGDSATDPNTVRRDPAGNFQIYTDPATHDAFIYHNNLRGAQYYLRNESRMRFYLSP